MAATKYGLMLLIGALCGSMVSGHHPSDHGDDQYNYNYNYNYDYTPPTWEGMCDMERVLTVCYTPPMQRLYDYIVGLGYQVSSQDVLNILLGAITMVPTDPRANITEGCTLLKVMQYADLIKCVMDFTEEEDCTMSPPQDPDQEVVPAFPMPGIDITNTSLAYLTDFVDNMCAPSCSRMNEVFNRAMNCYKTAQTSLDKAMAGETLNRLDCGRVRLLSYCMNTINSGGCAMLEMMLTNYTGEYVTAFSECDVTSKWLPKPTTAGPTTTTTVGPTNKNGMPAVTVSGSPLEAMATTEVPYSAVPEVEDADDDGSGDTSGEVDDGSGEVTDSTDNQVTDGDDSSGELEDENLLPNEEETQPVFHTNGIYMIIEKWMNFWEAQEECAKHDRHLVHVNFIYEQTFIESFLDMKIISQQLYQKGSAFWVGGHRAAVDNSTCGYDGWQWLDDNNNTLARVDGFAAFGLGMMDSLAGDNGEKCLYLTISGRPDSNIYLKWYPTACDDRVGLFPLCERRTERVAP